MVKLEVYRIESKQVSINLTLFYLMKQEEKEVDEVPSEAEDGKVLFARDGNEISIVGGKVDADYVLPKPVIVNRIGVPASVIESAVSLTFVTVGDMLVYGIKISQDLPFVYLETSEGTKIITMSEIKEPKSTRLEEPKREAKRVKRVKKSSSKRKSKSKSSRKSRRV